jgi:hypothetical protein
MKTRNRLSDLLALLAYGQRVRIMWIFLRDGVADVLYLGICLSNPSLRGKGDAGRCEARRTEKTGA